MNIQELEDKHNNVQILFTPKQNLGKEHTKLSVEFAINQLESLYEDLKFEYAFDWILEKIEDKIKELKQYLDENI